MEFVFEKNTNITSGQYSLSKELDRKLNTLRPERGLKRGADQLIRHICNIWGRMSTGISKPSSYFTGNTLRLRYRAQPVYKRFNVFTAVTMKNAVFRDVTPCGCCKNRRFGGTYRLRPRDNKNRRACNNVSNYQPKHSIPYYRLPSNIVFLRSVLR
jgi:hypothetical protein